ncbi:MAG: polysaccharide biosynthesis C-terminal domain-containing protein [Bacteroidetes bacterium]|nr:polysaccharide biosynthesis C-terminal domain-containing protein [Bacteroidota bacterium]
MGIVQKDALRVTVISYMGLVLGYLNKAVLMIVFLKVEEIGIVNLLLSIGLFFGQAANLGSTFSIWRFFPFFSDDKSRSIAFIQRMMTLVLMGCLLFAGIYFVFQDQIIEYYSENGAQFLTYSYWIFPIGVSYAFYLLYEVYLRSLFINVLPAFLFEFVLRLCVTITLLLFGFGFINFDSFIALHSIVYAVPTIYLSLYLWKKKLFTFRSQNKSTSKKLRTIIAKYSSISYLNTIGATAVVSIDAIMISGFLGLKATGIYTTIVYLTSALMVPYRSILRVCSPIIAKHWKRKEIKEMQLLYTQSSSISLFIALVLFTGIWINRFEIFSLLPQEYLIGIELFLILMAGRMVDMYLALNGAILSSSKKYSVDLIFTLFLLIGVIVSNYIFIPIYGLKGAAMATSVTIVLYNLLRLGYVQIQYKIHPFEKSQFYLILIFIAFLIGVELFFPEVEISIGTFFIKSALLGLLVLLPIYYFNIEKNASNYMREALNKILKIKSKSI